MSNLPSANLLAEVARLIGDPARANMLTALMGGQALTAGELARLARITPQTASAHLALLRDAGLTAMEKQGRHRYVRLASAHVANALQSLMVLAADGPPRHRPPGPQDAALRLARTCYDHMAGRLAVAVADALARQEFVVTGDGAALVTPEGMRFFACAGVDLDMSDSRRPLCRTCLDWSERRPHLAGRLGAALLTRALARGWITRAPQGRALLLSRAGEDGFIRAFGLPEGWREASPSPHPARQRTA